MPSQWDRQAHFFKLSCCLSQECLNKRAGERKGNYNSRERRKARGEGAFLIVQDNKPVFLRSLSEPSTWTHFKTQFKATQPGVTQSQGILCIRPVVSLYLIPLIQTCKSPSYSKRKKTGESNLSSYDLSVIWQYSLSEPLSPPTSTTVSPPPLGYQMCLAQFGMRHIQINILPRRATVESPRWVSKKNILSFICIARSPLMAALMLLYVLALDSYTHLWPWYNAPKSVFSISGRNEMGFLDNFRHIWYFSHTNSKVHAVFVLNRCPLTWSMCVYTLFGTHTHAVSCTETEMQHHQHTFQLLLDSPYRLHLLFIFLNPSVFPCSVHTQSSSHTFFFSLFHLHLHHFWTLWWNKPFFLWLL